MCGIVGVLYKDRARTVDPGLIRAMCDRIVHRGPDGEGIHVDGNCGFGMRRLAIIDLAGGDQPIFNEDRQVVTVFNGEIFNYRDLRTELEAAGHVFSTDSDTETLVHGYESWGEELPRRLNGMFGYTVWDARRRRLLLARDHVGIKPLYLYEDAEVLAWASEVKAFLALPEFSPELDRSALNEYLTFGYVPAPRSMFAGVRKLPAGSQLVVEGESSRERRYWDVEFEEHSDRGIDSWAEELGSLVDDAVGRQLMSDVPLGAFLSGGLDSSGIVASMKHLGTERISTYAIGFGAEDAFHDELPKAARVASQLGTDHHEIVVEPEVADLIPELTYHLDEPVTDTSFIVTYLVSKLARETVTVILSGVGGDELFAGYRRYLWPAYRKLHAWVPDGLMYGPIRSLVRRLPVDRGSRVKAAFRYLRGYLEFGDRPDPDRYQGYVQIFSAAQRMALLDGDLLALAAKEQPRGVASRYEAAGDVGPLNHMLYADLHTSLTDSLLAFTDKMSMAVSLEARVPLLDHRIVELAARIPPRFKSAGTRELKTVFKQALRGRLPEPIIDQRKQGFGTPISRWFRGSLKPLLMDVLSESRLRRRGLFDPASVQRLIADHDQQRVDNSEHLLALLTFELWAERFLDGGRPVTVLALVLWISLLAVASTYALYPVFVVALARLAGERIPPPPDDSRSVSLIVSAFNEAGIIRAKIENALALDYPAERLEIIVISDGSTDGTDDIVREYADRGVVLHRQDPQGGKSRGLTAFVPRARGEIVVFSDANSMYDPMAIRYLVSEFADERVGYVVGHQRYESEAESNVAQSESFYWNFEIALKRSESRLASVVGGDGAIYATRASLFHPLRDDDLSDFVNPLQTVRDGYRGVFDSRAFCTEHAASSFEGEFRRKVRIVNRALRGVTRVPGVLNPFVTGGFAFQLFFHKVVRWFVPYFLIAAFVSNASLVAGGAHALFGPLMLAQCAAYALAALGLVPRLREMKLVYLAYFFCLANMAALVGTAKFLRGERFVVWSPERG